LVGRRRRIGLAAARAQGGDSGARLAPDLALAIGLFEGEEPRADGGGAELLVEIERLAGEHFRGEAREVAFGGGEVEGGGGLGAISLEGAALDQVSLEPPERGELLGAAGEALAPDFDLEERGEERGEVRGGVDEELRDVARRALGAAARAPGFQPSG